MLVQLAMHLDCRPKVAQAKKYLQNKVNDALLQRENLENMISSPYMKGFFHLKTAQRKEKLEVSLPLFFFSKHF